MSESILLAGKRGSGKSLAAASMISRYLARGSPVATNLDIFVEHLVPAYCSTRFYRLPDWPTAAHLVQLPPGNPVPQNEQQNGLICLDEVGTFLNSRDWQGGGRQEFVNWLLQSRKLGWDLLLIAQHVNLVDKQIRESLIETQGTLRRLDKVRVPLLSGVWKYFTGKSLHFPKIHFASLRYGFGASAPAAETLFFRGDTVHNGYNTLQQLNPNTGQVGLSSMLSAYEIKGRKMGKWDMRRQMAAGGLVIGALLGAGLGAAGVWFWPKGASVLPVVEAVDAAVKVRGVARDDVGRSVVLLTDGRTLVATSVKADSKGVRYLVGATWYGS